MGDGAYISDLRHFMDGDGVLVREGGAGRFAGFLASIVEAACLRAGEVVVTTPVACLQPPKRKRCPGFITAGVVSREGGDLVEWSCPQCGMHGITSGWEGSAHDLRAVALPARGSRGGSPVAAIVAPVILTPLLPPPIELSPLEAAVERLRSGETSVRMHARRVEPRSQALYASLCELQRSLILTTGAIWPDLALEAARRFMTVLAEVGGHVQDEDDVAVIIEGLAVDIVALAREAGAPVLPELERMILLHEADVEFLLANLPRGLAQAGLTMAERDYLASRGLEIEEAPPSRERH